MEENLKQMLEERRKLEEALKEYSDEKLEENLARISKKLEADLLAVTETYNENMSADYTQALAQRAEVEKLKDEYRKNAGTEIQNVRKEIEEQRTATNLKIDEQNRKIGLELRKMRDELLVEMPAIQKELDENKEQVQSAQKEYDEAFAKYNAEKVALYRKGIFTEPDSSKADEAKEKLEALQEKSESLENSIKEKQARLDNVSKFFGTILVKDISVDEIEKMVLGEAELKQTEQSEPEVEPTQAEQPTPEAEPAQTEQPAPEAETAQAEQPVSQPEVVTPRKQSLLGTKILKSKKAIENALQGLKIKAVQMDISTGFVSVTLMDKNGNLVNKNIDVKDSNDKVLFLKDQKEWINREGFKFGKDSDPYMLDGITQILKDYLKEHGVEEQDITTDIISKYVNQYEKSLNFDKPIKDASDEELENLMIIEYTKSNEGTTLKAGSFRSFEKVLMPYMRKAKNSACVKIDSSIDTRNTFEKIKDAFGKIFNHNKELTAGEGKLEFDKQGNPIRKSDDVKENIAQQEKLFGPDMVKRTQEALAKVAEAKKDINNTSARNVANQNIDKATRDFDKEEK